VIVLDTSVLVYAVGGEHPLRGPSVRLIEAIERGTLKATTTVEVVQEFVHVFGRRRDRQDAARLGRAWAVLLSPLITIGRADLELGLALYENSSRLSAFDAVLASAAVARGADAFVSADDAFGEVAGLRHLDLASPALSDLLAFEG
jgi:uncharacterized protein